MQNNDNLRQLIEYFNSDPNRWHLLENRIGESSWTIIEVDLLLTSLHRGNRIQGIVEDHGQKFGHLFRGAEVDMPFSNPFFEIREKGL